MEIPIYQTQWHGIDLLQFPAAKEAQAMPAGPEFYAQFYAELARRTVDPAFAAGKAGFGAVTTLEFLEPWEKKYRRKPKILSLGVGKGYAEEVWLQKGYPVTLQECQEFSIRDLLKKYPGASSAIGDASKMEFSEKFDVVAILSLDSCLSQTDLRELLGRARTWLSPHGFILFQSTGVLSVRQAAAEGVKFLKRKFFPQPAVFWGWWRSIGELCRHGESAGFRLAGVYRFAKSQGPSGVLARRSFFTRKLPTPRSSLIVILFELPSSSHADT